MNNIRQPESEKEETYANHLAYERTMFAYERTALAYLRSAMTFLIGSVSLIKLFDIFWIQFVGALLIPFVFYHLIVGLKKFREINKVLEENKSNVKLHS